MAEIETRKQLDHKEGDTVITNCQIDEFFTKGESVVVVGVDRENNTFPYYVRNEKGVESWVEDYEIEKK